MTRKPLEPSPLRSGANALPDFLTTVGGLYAVIGGIITLIGWALPLPRFTDWAGRGISMFPNAAVCSIAGGLALLMLKHANGWRKTRITARLLAILTSIIGGITLFEHFTGINLGIDELLFEGTWGQTASASPMRIGVPASSSFLLLGAALALATGSPRLRRIGGDLAMVPIAIASLSLVGYWFGASQLFGVARYSGIAWQTGTIIVALGIGLVAALRESGFMLFLMRPDSGGLVARRMLLPIIAIPLVLGWGRILGKEYGLFDDAFGTALRTLLEIVLFLGFLWWTSKSITRHAAAAREATEAFYTSEQRFIRFMHSLPGLAWIKDADGRYVYANHCAMKAFDKDQDELYGNTDAEIFPKDTAEEFMANDRRALQELSGLQFIETMQQSDGTLHSSLVTKFPIPNSDGQPSLVGGIAIDITDRLRAEQELKETHRRKDEFLATLAHELRNPLSPIHFSVEICRSHPDPGKRDWALHVIDRQVRQMSRLLDDLLDVSRISYGKLTLRPERVELAGIVTSAAETSQPLRDEVGQALDIELPDHPIFLHADPVRLEQVFSNLLNNAAKYGGNNSQVFIKATTDDGNCIISVRDTGVGIPPDRLTDIFHMFSQVRSSANGSHGGLGIGLSLVQGLVKLHSGRIEARSEGIGRGSEFIVRLPLNSDGKTGTISQPDVEELSTRGSDDTPLRVLITDDLRDSADSLSACLRAGNNDVRTAYDGAEALKVAEDFRPDIVFLDIGMPKLGGDEVCRRIRGNEWGSKICIVAITGWGQDSDRRLTADAGFDHHLVKPVEISELNSILAMARTRGSIPPQPVQARIPHPPSE